MAITIGTDPEAFVIDEDGKVSIAVGKVGGSKTNPRLVDGGAVQEDNVLAEFNTAPASTADQFVSSVAGVIGELRKILTPVGLKPDFTRASHVFEVDQILEGGRQAREFGCEPDINAYTMDFNRKPQAADQCLRTAGGHVHIGYDNPDDLASACIVQACDVLLGIPSVLLDEDDRRRELYGAAGACRFKPYGVEYRVLSNFWVQSAALKRWVFGQATAAVSYKDDVGKLIDQAGGEDEVIRIINTGDTQAAAKVVKELGINMPRGG